MLLSFAFFCLNNAMFDYIPHTREKSARMIPLSNATTSVRYEYAEERVN